MLRVRRRVAFERFCEAGVRDGEKTGEWDRAEERERLSRANEYRAAWMGARPGSPELA